MKTRISLHHFISDIGLKQRDGVNLAHAEINQLLLSKLPECFSIEFHDFDKLLRDDKYAHETLSGIDCVLSNVGPHAHYYFFLRERLGLKFRIIRDIKTALWSSYLLQESLCMPFLNSGDVLLSTSNYSKKLIRKLFPHLIDHPIELFEPVLSNKPFPEIIKYKTSQKLVTLGHIGRLSIDKNFPQMIDLLINLDKEEPGRYRLVACGSIHSSECNPKIISDHLFNVTGRRDIFIYLPPIPHCEVMKLLSTFDYFLFFSTSNLEVLGRVLIECAYAGVPVLAANHAAAPEILDPSSLLKVKYDVNQKFYMHFDHALGHVDIDFAMKLIINQHQPLPPNKPINNNFDTLIRAISGDIDHSNIQFIPTLGLDIEDFIRNLDWDGLPTPQSKLYSYSSMTNLHKWFCELNGKQSEALIHNLKKLQKLSKFPDRTNKYIDTISTTKGDFTNIGGIDIELCNVADFHPKFWIQNGKRQ